MTVNRYGSRQSEWQLKAGWPGLMRAGSRVSIRLVAIITFTSPRESKPSNWLSSSNMVLWISLSPPEFESYLHNTDREYLSGECTELDVFLHLTKRRKNTWTNSIFKAGLNTLTNLTLAHPPDSSAAHITHHSCSDALCLSLSGSKYLLVPMASISSMKTMEGACSSATRKSSRTSLGPSPRYFWINSEPTTRRNVADVWLATALASSVLPVD